MEKLLEIKKQMEATMHQQDEEMKEKQRQLQFYKE